LFIESVVTRWFSWANWSCLDRFWKMTF